MTRTQLDTAMQKLSAHSTQLWFWTLGGTNPWDPHRLAQWWLQTYTLDVGRVDYHGVGFEIYEAPYGFLQHAPKLPPRSFGGHIEALAAVPKTSTVAVGSTLTVTICWKVISAPHKALTAFVHLERNGRLFAQKDRPPLHNIVPTQYWQAGDEMLDVYHVPIGRSVPPGTYNLVIGLYDQKTLQRLPLLDAHGVVVGNALVAGHIDVASH
jgi:hypothetical protein